MYFQCKSQLSLLLKISIGISFSVNSNFILFYPEEIKVNSIKEVTTNHYLKNDTLTTEGQTKFPEYDVKETTEGTENGSEYEDEIDIEYGGGEVFYPGDIKENSTNEKVITNQHFKNDTLTTEGQTKFPEYDV